MSSYYANQQRPYSPTSQLTVHPYQSYPRYAYSPGQAGGIYGPLTTTPIAQPANDDSPLGLPSGWTGFIALAASVGAVFLLGRWLFPGAVKAAGKQVENTVNKATSEGKAASELSDSAKKMELKTTAQSTKEVERTQVQSTETGDHTQQQQLAKEKPQTEAQQGTQRDALAPEAKEVKAAADPEAKDKSELEALFQQEKEGKPIDPVRLEALKKSLPAYCTVLEKNHNLARIYQARADLAAGKTLSEDLIQKGYANTGVLKHDGSPFRICDARMDLDEYNALLALSELKKQGKVSAEKLKALYDATGIDYGKAHVKTLVGKLNQYYQTLHSCWRFTENKEERTALLKDLGAWKESLVQ